MTPSRCLRKGGTLRLELGAFCGLCSMSAAARANRETRSRAVTVSAAPAFANKPGCHAPGILSDSGAAIAAMPAYLRP
eukprot:9133218-Heterocapsa_arctica.AAC.1